MTTNTSEFVKHHGRAFAFFTQGLTEDGCSAEAALDLLHAWMEPQPPEKVAALHTALMATEGRDRKGFDLPELAEITRAEEAALFVSVPPDRAIMPYQIVVIRPLLEH